MARRRKRDPLAGPRPEPFGATKARGVKYAKQRKLFNRIHELEEQVAILERREAHAHARAEEAERKLAGARPNVRRVLAMEAFARLPAITLIELEAHVPRIVDHALELGRYALELQGKRDADAAR